MRLAHGVAQRSAFLGGALLRLDSDPGIEHPGGAVERFGYTSCCTPVKGTLHVVTILLENAKGEEQ
jgi:hypothetical protein